jgi:DNA-binding NarL/FixJ family response regulator
MPRNSHPADTPSSFSLLVVEDHDRVRTSLMAWLAEAVPGARVRGVGSGEAALEALAADPAELVLMDVGLPGISGIDATREIRARWPDTQVLVLTIHEPPEYRERALAAGAAGFVPKRTMGSDLLPLVRAAAGTLTAGDGSP